MGQTAYKYRKDTGEYVGPVECQISPKEEGTPYLQPGSSLLVAPPETQEFEKAVALGDAWVVVPDHRNRTFYDAEGHLHYVEALGDMPDPLWTTEPPVLPEPPISVTPWQFRKALNSQNLRQTVEDAVTASTDQNLKDGWEFATQFVRNDPFVVSMGAALGKTDAEMDGLFELASSL